MKTEEITKLIQDSKSCIGIANAGRKSEAFPEGKERTDDYMELGQWLLADNLAKAIRIIEALATPNLSRCPSVLSLMRKLQKEEQSDVYILSRCLEAYNDASLRSLPL